MKASARWRRARTGAMMKASKSARLHPTIMIIAVIALFASALYTGSQPGRKPLIKLQTKESLEGVTGRAVPGMGGIAGWKELF